MKKVFLLSLFIVLGLGINAAAQGKANIKFEKTTQNTGSFSEKSPVVHATYVFTNIGDSPLVVHEVITSCGCTVPEYSKQPIQPGAKGQIKVTYDGKGKPLGYFKKSIIVRTNSSTPTTRLFIEGTMTE